MGDQRHLGAFDRRARFEEDVGIPFLLSPDRIQDHHRQPARQRFGCCHPAGFAQQDRRRAHEIRHLTGVAKYPEVVRPVAHKVLHGLLELGIFSADHDGLEIEIELEKSAHDGGCGAQPEGSAGNKQRRTVRTQAMPQQNSRGVHRLFELRLHGNSGHLDVVARQAERLHVDFVLLLGHEIPVERPRDPERVEVEIRHHNPEARIQLPVEDQPRHDARRHEVRAENDVRTELFDQVDQRQRLREIECQPAFVRDPRVVARLIPPA